VLKHEGGYSNVLGDAGGETNHGITEVVARRHGYVGEMRDLPLGVAAAIYRQDYWHFDGIHDQGIATKIFDLAVNMGVGSAVRMAQRVLSEHADGIYGPATEAAINGADPVLLMNQLCQAAADRYHAIVDRCPGDTKFIDGWLRRAEDRP